MPGVGIEQTEDGFFILRRDAIEMKMTSEEFHSLKAQIDLWSDRIHAQFQARTGEAPAIVSHPIASAAGVWPDAIQENVLLTLTSTSGTKTVFSVPKLIAQDLVDALRRILDRMQSSPMA
jgi:hypothetical protein